MGLTSARPCGNPILGKREDSKAWLLLDPLGRDLAGQEASRGKRRHQMYERPPEVRGGTRGRRGQEASRGWMREEVERCHAGAAGTHQQLFHRAGVCGLSRGVWVSRATEARGVWVRPGCVGQ